MYVFHRIFKSSTINTAWPQQLQFAFASLTLYWITLPVPADFSEFAFKDVPVWPAKQTMKKGSFIDAKNRIPMQMHILFNIKHTILLFSYYSVILDFSSLFWHFESNKALWIKERQQSPVITPLKLFKEFFKKKKSSSRRDIEGLEP